MIMPRFIIALVGAALLIFIGLTSAGAAQAPETPPSPPPELRDLMRLLDKPAVRAWIEANTPAEAAPSAVGTPAPNAPLRPADGPEGTMMGEASDWLTGVRKHLAGIVMAVPRIPDETAAAARRLGQDMEGPSLFGSLLLILGFASIGFGAEAAFRAATRSGRRHVVEMPRSTFADRARVHALRLGFGGGRILAFLAGSIGAFLLFAWPPLLKETVLAILLAVLATRIAVVMARFVLSPQDRTEYGNEADYRLLPMSDAAAAFWFARTVAFVSYFAVGYAVVSLMRVYGFSIEVRQLAAYTLGLGLLAIAVEAVWRRPPTSAPVPGWRRSRAFNALLTAYLVALWLVWVIGAMRLFWIGVYVAFLPPAVRIVGNVARAVTGRHASDGPGSVGAVVIERGARALLLVLAALWLARGFGIDLETLSGMETVPMRLARGAIASVVILLVADFLWQVIKVVIASRLEESEPGDALGPDENARRGRLRTLLPIFRNVLFIVVAVTAGLMALASLGIEIGPLIAGAGVVGVAVGFGAQTLVKDIISGIFFMLDDAFRVGEYIQSKSYKGTVESFSLRSVKLRHHRGPVFTVPFGELGAVQNMSRDWVIDKFEINVTYDTDLEKARKLIKTIGQELAKDPEFAPNVISPLKMQGVERFGEYAIQIRCKMTTKPGEQFILRRKALARIKQAFVENGIAFAFPMVQVAGGEEAAPAAARQMIEHLHAGKPAAE
jgi:small-conductance mechanosensitive channel